MAPRKPASALQPPASTIVRSGRGHSYKCREGQKNCYLRYLANNQHGKNKARRIAKDKARKAADKTKVLRVFRGFARAARRWQDNTTLTINPCQRLLDYQKLVAAQGGQ